MPVEAPETQSPQHIAFAIFIVAIILVLIVEGIRASFRAMVHTRTSKRVEQHVAFGVLALATVAVLFPVVLIVLYVVMNGAGAIDWKFLTQNPSMGGKAGGIFPAIIGTFYLMVATALFALPVGVLAGVYLTEYARDNWLTRAINLAIVSLAGVPSIVFGLFGLSLFVLGLRFGYSLLAASLTLACQALAVTVTTSREALLAVPKDYKDGSLALGVTRWQTVRHVILPQARPGIITGVVLAMSRAAGETAPILITGAAFLLPGLPKSPLDQFMALPYHLYTVSSHVPGMPQGTKWGVALVLLLVVLLFNILATWVRLKSGQGK